MYAGVRGARWHYPLMSLQEIVSMPVAEVADSSGSHLYLWVTGSFMREGYDVAAAWGFEVKQVLTWYKPQMGMGFYYRNNTEHVLFGIRGRLDVLTHNLTTGFAAPRRKHSQKPPEFFERVERMSPAPRLELFARDEREGWTVWGDEISEPLLMT